MKAGIRAVALLLVIAGCASMHRTSDLPRIDRVEPDTVTIGDGMVTQIVVHGSGFVGGKPGQNTVNFAGTTLTGVPASDDGRTIRIVLPTTVPSGGDAAPLPLDAGRYTLTVRTLRGESNGAIVRVGR